MTLSLLYSVQREFNVSIDKLWYAWTDSFALESWHHPVGMSCVPGSTQSEMKIGGLWSYAVQVPGRESISYFFGKYSLVQENLRFEHSMHYTESKDAFKDKDFNTPAHQISVEFEARGEKSWSKFSQYGEAPKEQVVMMAQGMESYFDSLEDFLQS
jgi:uncharacterized protein YndB with AHSA1/START domain